MEGSREMAVITSPRGQDKGTIVATNSRLGTLKDTFLLTSWVLGYALVLGLFGLMKRME
jgi:hypothetical protein